MIALIAPGKPTRSTSRQSRQVMSLGETNLTGALPNRRCAPNIVVPSNILREGAPVSHQKRRDRNVTDATEFKRKRRQINEADRYPAAHNGLVAGSSPAGPTTTNSNTC